MAMLTVLAHQFVLGHEACGDTSTSLLGAVQRTCIFPPPVGLGRRGPPSGASCAMSVVVLGDPEASDRLRYVPVVRAPSACCLAASGV